MFNSIKLGSPFGISVYIHPAFWLLPIFYLFSNLKEASLFHSILEVFLLFAVFFCVILHEFGHAFAARIFGIQTRDITIYPMGGVARLERMSEDPFEELVISLAGPAVNLLIFVLLLFSIDSFNMQGTQDSDAGQRYAGEGANPNTFQLGPKEYIVSFTYPFKVDSWGYLDFSLAAFFDYCIEAFKGSPTSFIGRFTTDNASTVTAGTSQLYIDNISEFMGLSLPFQAKIKSDTNTSYDLVTVTAINKADRLLTIGAGVNVGFSRDTSYISAYPQSNGKEASFSL